MDTPSEANDSNPPLRKRESLVFRFAPAQQRPPMARRLSVDLTIRTAPPRSIAMPIRTISQDLPTANASRKDLPIRTTVEESTTAESLSSGQLQPQQEPQDQSSQLTNSSKPVRINLPIHISPPELDPTNVQGYNNTRFWWETISSAPSEMDYDSWRESEAEKEADKEYAYLLGKLKTHQSKASKSKRDPLRSFNMTSAKTFHASKVTKPKPRGAPKGKNVQVVIRTAEKERRLAPATRQRLILNERIRKVREEGEKRNQQKQGGEFLRQRHTFRFS